MAASPSPAALRARYDVAVVGAGHNGLVAAAYLARAGYRVAVLERGPAPGGAAVSARVFPGQPALLSRYSYLVSLLPHRIVDDLGLRITLRRRRIGSYTPTLRGGRPGGLLVDAADPARTRASFAALTGSDREYEAWRRFQAMTGHVAGRVFPTLTGPLPTRDELRRRIDDPTAWTALFERPLGETIEAVFHDDLVRGVVLTDALIGTFTHAHDPTLRQNRCFLYHVIGGGTGDWQVPVGGMGTLTAALVATARDAGADLALEHEVTGIDATATGVEVRFRPRPDQEGGLDARLVLAGVAPYTLAGLLGDPPPAGSRPEGSQLKINMLLRRLPRLRDRTVDPRDAFTGTFHVAESYAYLADAHRQASAGHLPRPAPGELYCHTLTDPSILGGDLAARGLHTLTLFDLHVPARLFRSDPAGARQSAVRNALDTLDAHLAEPITDCLAVDAAGRPCLEARTPLDLEQELAMPGGHIFHGDLEFPFSQAGPGASPEARWGVATGHPRVLLCGAGAVRGGGVSGIGGHNAAMAALTLLGHR